MTTLTVVRPGPLTTVQDGGRSGLGALGVGRSGACDLAAWRLGNRLVGNDPGDAGLEVTFGGLALRTDATVTLAVTGAPCLGCAHDAPFALAPGETLAIGTPPAGLRTYVAVRGGVAVEPVLGSRSWDVLAGIGPPPLAAGADARWEVSGDSDRDGIRLSGPALERERQGELPSEGMCRDALQVPPSGQPVLFLADHPVTGGYPVIAYVRDDDVDRCAQLRPGQVLRLVTGTRPG